MPLKEFNLNTNYTKEAQGAEGKNSTEYPLVLFVLIPNIRDFVELVFKHYLNQAKIIHLHNMSGLLKTLRGEYVNMYVG